MAELIATEVGMPLKLAAMIQVGLPVAQIGNYAQILSDFPFEEACHTGGRQREAAREVGAAQSLADGVRQQEESLVVVDREAVIPQQLGV